ncbi:UDP-N-acetylmuramate dehydrogenase [Marinomonas sp. THO17]|uniref:UDP-N-acetylmuramate dehydrogenase n=1 Tax=Marinomonas sp. THO17 TaxID=3149048 RepID=UPI00336C1E5D
METSRPIPNAITHQVSLKAYNTFRFDYQAEFFAEVHSLLELKQLLGWAQQEQLPVTILGGGSNLLIRNDIKGLVLINCIKGKQVIEGKYNQVHLVLGAGENWHHVVTYSVEKNWFGIENLALIPGTVGAAPVQNIGAYGVEIKDVLARVQVIDRQTLDVFWINAKECGFAYRDSHFKGKWKDKYFITGVELSLKKRGELCLSYGGLQHQLEGEPSLRKVYDAVCRVRASKLPDPQVIANAGSFFKNPIISADQHTRLKKMFPDMVSFPHGDDFKLAAGWLIDQAGFKGKSQQGVGVYEKQALVLVNHEANKAEALLALEADIQNAIQNKYGVCLEREPVLLPEIIFSAQAEAFETKSDANQASEESQS